MSTKSDKAREMYGKGIPVAEISLKLDMAKTAVYKAISRLSPEQKRKQPGSYAIKSTQAHKIFEPWKGKPAHTPRGTCVYFIPQEGRVCGALCKGQRCKDQPQGVAHTIRIGARTGGGLAA